MPLAELKNPETTPTLQGGGFELGRPAPATGAYLLQRPSI
jgi:hypothetical protein